MNYDVTIQNIAWFNELRNNGALTISPSWQRRAVWLDKERETLIETILLNLPFPEVYIQVTVVPDTGKQSYIVVDGQQRITSILRFIDGAVTLPSTDRWGGKSFRQLGEEEKKSFWAYKIVVRQIDANSEAEIRELFQRLNSNTVALNDQELRNAKYIGKFKQAAERLADNPFFQNIRLFTPREIRRMEDVEYVSELLLLQVEGVSNKKDLLDITYARFEEDFPNESQFEQEFNAAIMLVASIVDDDNAVYVKTKSNFYSLFGAAVQFVRSKKRLTFSNSDAAKLEISTLLTAVKSYDPEGQGIPQVISDYYDAVSRAATDKQRRVKRERILFDIFNRY